MKGSSYAEFFFSLEGRKEVFLSALESVSVNGMSFKEKEEGVLLRVTEKTPETLLKSSHSLVTQSLFILRSIKELETLK